MDSIGEIGSEMSSAVSDEERRPGRARRSIPRARRRGKRREKEKREDIRYIVRDGPRMTFSWENPMVEPPQSNVKGKGAIFDVYIQVTFNGTEYLAVDYDDTESEISGPDSEVGGMAVGEDKNSEVGDEATQNNLDARSEEHSREASEMPDNSGIRAPGGENDKAEVPDEVTQINLDPRLEEHGRVASEIHREASISIAGGEGEKVGDLDEAAHRSLDTKRRARAYRPRPRSTREVPPRPAEVQGMTIYSPHVLKAIRSLVTYYPAQLLTGKFMSVDSPFKMLFHYYHDLQRLLDEGQAKEKGGFEGTDDKETEIDEAKERNHHLSVLLDYLRPRHLSFIKPAEDRFRDGVSSYAMLWFLYKPGCDAYGKVGGMLTGFVVASAKEDSRRFRSPANGDERLEHFWTIKGWNLDHTNGKFVRVTRSFKINKYDGEKDITTLPIFPSQYLDLSDGGKTRRTLENRGRMYFEYVRAAPVHLRYKGPAWDHRIYPRMWKKEPKLVRLAISIVDFC
jgi:Domain of unknown function (DUF7025)